jgi:prepilin peptidase CpaA
MAFSPIAAYFTLVITAATLFYVALTDLKEFKIRNELLLVLAALYVIFAGLSGHWRTMHWNIALAAVMFAGMLYFYNQNLMGGGDVKMLTVAFLWVGLDCAFIFAIFLLLFVGIHAGIAKLGWVKVQEVRTYKRIPLAPSIAAALIAVFMSGCLRPLPLPPLHLTG